jgi:hypothetical protein
MGWVKILLPGDVLQALAVGRAGIPPAATAADVADFLVVVPYQMEALELRATLLLAPAALTRVQMRRSADGGNTWVDHFGFVDIPAGARKGMNTPPPAVWNEGDLVNFSVVSGGGSGENLTVLMLFQRV